MADLVLLSTLSKVPKYRIVPMKRPFLIGLYGLLSCCTLLQAQEITELQVFQDQVVALRDQEQGTRTPLKMDLPKLRAAYEQGLADRLTFRLPLKREGLSFPLQRVDLFHPSFQLTRANGKVQEIITGRHYQAFQGDTLITLSVFPTGLQAQVNTADESFTLAADPRQPEQYYWKIEQESDRQVPISCHTSDEIRPGLKRSMQELDQSVYLRSALPALSVYFEMDHYIYQEQGEDLDNCLLLMAGIFNAVAQIYRLEGIGLQLRGLKVWDQPDPFATEDAREAIFSFRGYLPATFTEEERDWDIEFLLSRYTDEEGLAPNGGLANINSLCNLRRRQAYANIGSTYQNYPEYSWTVFVIAHEIGHTIASPHSHNCFWPEGPLDDCYCPEGSCDPGPSVVEQGGGTLMSYCYLQEPFSNFCQEFPSGGNVGVNYLRAFGKYPGDLMRQRIQEKACLRDRPVEQLPNLRVKSVQQLSRVNDTLVVEGLLIENTGVREAFLFHIGIFQEADLIGAIPIQQLAAGDSIPIDFELLLPATNRSLDFSFHLDILQEVAEWHEGDNFYQDQLREWQDFPILNLASDSLWTDTEYYFIFPNFRLQNTGWAGSSPLDIRCYLEYEDQRTLMLSQKKVSSVEADSAFRFSVGAYEPALALPAGKYFLRIEIITENGMEVYRWPEVLSIRGASWEWFRK